MSPLTCLASHDDGSLSRALATILDHQRGGKVCLQHVPADVAEEITRSLKMGTMEGRLDHDGEVYCSCLGDPRCSSTSPVLGVAGLCGSLGQTTWTLWPATALTATANHRVHATPWRSRHANHPPSR
jgi:hypothetical protein